MANERMSNGMNRGDRTAFSLFAFLCLAGILTLFSQTSMEPRSAHGGGARRTLMDPSPRASSRLDELLPGAVERSASLHAVEDEKEDKKEDKRKILRLR